MNLIMECVDEALYILIMTHSTKIYCNVKSNSSIEYVFPQILAYYKTNFADLSRILFY